MLPGPLRRSCCLSGTSLPLRISLPVLGLTGDEGTPFTGRAAHIRSKPGAAACADYAPTISGDLPMGKAMDDQADADHNPNHNTPHGRNPPSVPHMKLVESSLSAYA